MSQLLTIITIVACTDLVLGALLALPTSANCGNQTVLTCTSTNCSMGYRFIRNGSIIYYNGGPLSGADKGKFSGANISDSEVQLTITNIQLSDSTTYACACGFDKISASQILQYECKATTSKATITNEKKLNITVDSLYPQPSRVETSLTNASTSTQLSGIFTCVSSPTLTFHYRCTWLSTSSLNDGNHGYTMAVTTGTETATVTGSFRIVTPTSPKISNLEINSIYHQVLRGVQDIPLTIRCMSSGGIPAPTLAWYRDSTSTSPLTQSSISNSVHQSDGSYNVSLTHTFTPRREDDLKTFLCQVFYPGATNETSANPIPATAVLYIDYPPLIQPLLNITSTEGKPNVSMKCLASSKPPANFSWQKEDKVLSNGTGTITDNSFSYVLSRVDRTDAGSYKCQAGNNVGSSDLKIMYLTVKHPPAVTVSTTHSLNSLTYTVTCKAEGYPENYTYQDWVQIWPGYGQIATIRFTGATLNLTGASYERSGVYVCGASNGVAVYGTDVKFMKGNATVIIKAPPVLTDPFPDGTTVLVAGRLGQNATTEIKYWSNVNGSIVKCYKSAGDSRSNSSSCSVMETEADVNLPVFKQMVNEIGTLAIITIHISSQEDMTAYDVVVSNVQGQSVLGISIVPKGPPEAPSLKGNVSIAQGQVILTVVPGFHGGCNQTLVVQINTDLTTWINKTSVYIGLDPRPTDVTLAGLRKNTLHQVRVFAYNTEGRSNNFSTVMNFTTAKDPPTTNPPAALIGAAVGTTCALLVVAVVLFVLCRKRKAGWMFSKKTDKRSPAQDPDNTGSVVECAMYVSTGNVQPGTSKCCVYSTPQKRERVDPSANVYAVVSKTKKGKDKVAASTTEDPKGLYAAPMKVQGGKKMEKPGKPSQGIHEIPQSVETTLDATNKSPFNQYPRSTKSVNEDGLIYADLEFDRPAKNGVIHGLEDAIVYVDIDITKTAEPLPDSDMEYNERKN